MNDMELLKSAGLYGRDITTGEEGLNLAAIMLLGKDDVILNVAPMYVTDALVRRVNVDRYDDREIIKTNLVESYDRLLEFGRKHLPDKFFLENSVNKNLRNTIIREMISNTLMHREFSSSYTAKFVIEKECMYVENASRAANNGCITVENLEPNPKNPMIAAFFRNIGYAISLAPACGICLNIVNTIQGRNRSLLREMYSGSLFLWMKHIPLIFVRRVV